MILPEGRFGVAGPQIFPEKVSLNPRKTKVYRNIRDCASKMPRDCTFRGSSVQLACFRGL
jgi:hypothetical protein